tara:strand:- start:4295 stop:5032 length:738 start_codon:yes stop_codon:yes gene_type:complete
MIDEQVHQSSLIITILIFCFAIIHSGGASLRNKVEPLIGERLWRIIFAIASIPSALILIAYFLVHRYDGIRLWNFQGSPFSFYIVWLLTAISFIFLYPATYNLLEIPAIQKPTVRIYSTGIMRVTRHPQAFGQILWCIAHSYWIGTSFMIVTSFGLILHHLFAIWHGDKRLEYKFGEEFFRYKSKTSIIPFKAIIDGRQKLQMREFLKPSQIGICIAIAVLWWSHRFISSGTNALISSKLAEFFS